MMLPNETTVNHNRTVYTVLSLLNKTEFICPALDGGALGWVGEVPTIARHLWFWKQVARKGSIEGHAITGEGRVSVCIQECRKRVRHS